MLPRLNPLSPPSAEAAGFLPPLLRAATHIGFDIAWVAATSDEEWELRQEGNNATREKVRIDLIEVREHINPNNLPDYGAFVNDEAVQVFEAVNLQATSLVDNLADSRLDTLEELKILADNLAYAATVFEHHVTGSRFATEGRNA
jgi:pantothenate synthetase